MKKFISFMLITVLMALGGCSKFLNVEPLDSLSGNNFWKTQEDVESFTRDIYRLFRDGLAVRSGLILMGDLRTGPVKSTSAYPPRGDFNLLAKNDIKTLVSTPRIQGNVDTFWQLHGAWDDISDWQPIYKVIQASNILYDQVPGIIDSDPSFSPKMAKQYQGEAVFMRCLSYFYLIRLFGDVPYYTKASNQEALPRMDMNEVAKNCIADLEAIREDLPWTYADPANRGVRAMQGSVLALQMEFNMWLAAFDEANKTSYYNEVDRLGDILTNEGEMQQGAYHLYPIEDIAQVFIGRSQEGLFEIPQNANYGDVLGNIRRTFTGAVLHEPYLRLNATNPYSEMAYYSAYMKILYPEGQPDGRKDVWFDSNIYAENGAMQCFKFFNLALGENNNVESLSNYFIIFRYAESILLQAEALAELENDEKAIQLLNRIRTRAKTAIFPAEPGEGDLKDAIFWERCKELMGEGHYYYDMVRTRRVLDGEYSFNPMSYSDFMQGAWTWPINPKALTNNNNMTLNEFWR